MKKNNFDFDKFEFFENVHFHVHKYGHKYEHINDKGKNPSLFCKLNDDGSILFYSMCSQDADAYQDIQEKLEYLGQGQICNIYGDVVDSRQFHFWRWAII